MTNESKTHQPNIEPLELNRETLRDLTENEAEGVAGGARTTEVNRSAGRWSCAPSCTC